jgi:zinc/manganese transport system ATP-binding protein
VAVLEVRGLRASLGGRRVLHEVGFSLGAGEFCGLFGANGSGKTTLLRTILGTIRPDGGTIRIDRGPAGAPPGYVPQLSALDPNLPLRARDLVALGLDGHRFGLPWPSRRTRTAVDRMLAAVEATAFADARVGELSGGQQQRVLIAHALIREPSLLLLDEPLAGLDVRSVATVVALLRRLASERGVAVLMAAHDVNPLMGALDRVVYLAGGRAASGAAEQVIRTEVLSRLYGHHVDVLRVHGRVVVVAGGGEDAGDMHAEPIP